MATQPLPELIQFKAPRGFSRALDVVADKTYEARASVIRRALLQLFIEHGVEVDELAAKANGSKS